mmetsp:Transcript_27396/g.77113  ORF Transcript_27396/g.77113 Transcript_27396/m.77113 type:complete len:250 (-) Transcript_27396:13-762(-)
MHPGPFRHTSRLASCATAPRTVAAPRAAAAPTRQPAEGDVGAAGGASRTAASEGTAFGSVSLLLRLRQRSKACLMSRACSSAALLRNDGGGGGAAATSGRQATSSRRRHPGGVSGSMSQGSNVKAMVSHATSKDAPSDRLDATRAAAPEAEAAASTAFTSPSEQGPAAGSRERTAAAQAQGSEVTGNSSDIAAPLPPPLLPQPSPTAPPLARAMGSVAGGAGAIAGAAARTRAERHPVGRRCAGGPRTR